MVSIPLATNQQSVPSVHLPSAERTRCITAVKKVSITYLTIIETAKMWGLQVKEYLTYVWREVMSGNTNYGSMTPEVVIAKRNS